MPPRHVDAITKLRNLIESLGAYVKIVIVSHTHGSVVNEQDLVTAVQYSRLLVDCVFITTERTGVLGKFSTLKSVTDGQIIISDDHPGILAEFQENSQISIQVRKPRQPQVLGWEFSTVHPFPPLSAVVSFSVFTSHLNFNSSWPLGVWLLRRHPNSTVSGFVSFEIDSR